MRYPEPKIFTPQNPKKYAGDPKKIVARSGLEVRFFKWLDNTPEIIFWSSEEFFIGYISPLDNKPHRYFPDIMFKVKNAEGEKTYVAEIKPDSQTRPPSTSKGKKKTTLLREVMTWSVNEAKWNAAEKWCQERGFIFIKLTEKHIRIKW